MRPFRRCASLGSARVWLAGAQVRMLGTPWAKRCGLLPGAGFKNSRGASIAGKSFAWGRASQYKKCDDDSAKKHGNALQPEQEDIATISSKTRSKQFLKFYLFRHFVRNSGHFASLESQPTDCISPHGSHWPFSSVPGATWDFRCLGAKRTPKRRSAGSQTILDLPIGEYRRLWNHSATAKQ